MFSLCPGGFPLGALISPLTPHIYLKLNPSPCPQPNALMSIWMWVLPPNADTPILPTLTPFRETRVHGGGDGHVGQWRFHCSGAQQPNAQHQEHLPKEERDQVRNTHTHTHTSKDPQLYLYCYIFGVCVWDFVSRSPPRPSPGGLHYSDDDICNNYNGAVLTESTTLTEKQTEVSESEVSFSLSVSRSASTSALTAFTSLHLKLKDLVAHEI